MFGFKKKFTDPKKFREDFINKVEDKSDDDEFFQSDLFKNRPTERLRKFKENRRDDINAKDGFMGTVNMKTLFTVGEGGKKEHVTRKKKNNIFGMGGF